MKVFVNALPKSGTNLLQKLMELCDMKYDQLGIASSLIRGDKYFIRQLIRGALFDKSPVIIGFESPVAISSRWLNKRINKVPEGNFFSGHVNYSDRFYRILLKNEIKTIHIVRDPRAVLLSHINYFSQKKGYYLYNLLHNKSLEEKLNITLNGGSFPQFSLELESFEESLRKVDGWSLKENVHIVRFEDLIGQKGGGSSEVQKEELSKILKFIEFPEEKIDEQIQFLQENLFGGTHTYRKGKVDSWKAEFNDDQVNMIEKRLSDYLIKWNYK